MPLTQRDIITLTGYLLGPFPQTRPFPHPALVFTQDQESWMQLTGGDYLFDMTAPKNEYLIFNVLAALDYAEKGNIFTIGDASNWIGTLCEKVSANEDVEVIALGDTTAERKATMRLLINAAINNLTVLGLADISLESLIFALITRDFKNFVGLTQMFVADGIISEVSYERVLVEFSRTPRWQTIGLSTAPTQAEIDAILNP